MIEITLDQFEQLADEGTIFTVSFTKRTTGEERIMNCRRGVKKGVKGVGHSFDPKKKALLSVYDMQKAGFRFINLEDLHWARIGGQEYRITG